MQACILFYATGLGLDGGNLKYHCQSHFCSSTSSELRSLNIAFLVIVSLVQMRLMLLVVFHPTSDTICNCRPRWKTEYYINSLMEATTPTGHGRSRLSHTNTAQCRPLRPESFRTRANGSSNVGHDIDNVAEYIRQSCFGVYK